MKSTDDMSWIAQLEPIIVATHPRSGTHLVIDLLRKQFKDCQSWKYLGETKNNLYLDIDPLLFSSRIRKSEKAKQIFARQILQRAKRPVIKTHCLKTHIDKHSDWAKYLTQRSDIIYIVRDGRSVLCSLHRFVSGYDKKANCCFSEFIRQEQNGMSRCKKWANHVLKWIEIENVSIFQFEKVIKKTAPILDSIEKNLGLTRTHTYPLLPKSIQSRQESIWLSLTQTMPESTTHMNFSKDQPAVGKHWDVFSKDDYRFFYEETGDLLVQLGYESSNQWAY
jgi:hypothetical protein